jgi:hypothetical protein
MLSRRNERLSLYFGNRRHCPTGGVSLITSIRDQDSTSFRHCARDGS